MDHVKFKLTNNNPHERVERVERAILISIDLQLLRIRFYISSVLCEVIISVFNSSKTSL